MKKKKLKKWLVKQINDYSYSVKEHRWADTDNFNEVKLSLESKIEAFEEVLEFIKNN